MDNSFIEERIERMTREEIFNLIEEEDVEFIRLQFTNVWGILKNIAVTPAQLERVLDYMYAFEGGALFDDACIFEEDVYLYPDLDTFVILPWRPQQGKVAKLICDVCYKDGSLCDYSPRTVLKKVIEDAKKEGYTFKVASENEFFLFHTDDNGNATNVSHEKAGYLDVGPADFGENTRRDIVLTLEEMGFEIESSHHEKAPAQHEIDFAEGESLSAADSIMTFRFAVRSIAKRFGLNATFMPKPRTDCAGSGMHLNFSIYKDGVSLFDNIKGDEISLEAKYFMGGIMAHAESLCAITNPIVNSYKRIVSGYEAPRNINWSTKGEQSMLIYKKSFDERKVEARFPDSSADPYLAIAVCIAAGLDGIKNQIMPGEANSLKGKQLPGNLKDALRHYKKDELIFNTVGKNLSKMMLDVKEKAWSEYMAQVSDWEIERYLNKI